MSYNNYAGNYAPSKISNWMKTAISFNSNIILNSIFQHCKVDRRLRDVKFKLKIVSHFLICTEPDHVPICFGIILYLSFLLLQLLPYLHIYRERANETRQYTNEVECQKIILCNTMTKVIEWNGIKMQTLWCISM